MSLLKCKKVINIDNHALKLFRYVVRSFDVNNVDNKNSDVKVIAGLRTFYCHKFVLQFGSDYFDNLSFESDTVTLEDVNPDQLYEALQFMYTGEVLLSINNIESLLTVAEHLSIKSLIRICLRFIEDILYPSAAKVSNFHKKLDLAYRSAALRYFKKLKSPSSLLNASEAFMKAVLSADELDVKSEVEVCEMLMKWSQVQTEAGHEVHPDQLLPLIRWSGISVDYVKSKLLQNTTLTSDPVILTPTSLNFLQKVLTYLTAGVQFDGLQTFHRPSTKLERCLITVGWVHRIVPDFRAMLIQWNDDNLSNVRRISLQKPDEVTTIKEIPTKMTICSAGGVCNNTVYVTGTGSFHRETWKWTPTSGWNRCADMPTGRILHCVAVIDSTLFVLGGWVRANNTTLSSVECYDVNTDEWSSVGNLIHAVDSAASVAYMNLIYVFGGTTENYKAVGHVQIYDPSQRSCTLMDKPMPRAYLGMGALLWETSVILLGCETCFIYNFDTETWQERQQFKTDVDFFASNLDNSIVYIAGGGINMRNDDNKSICTCTNEIKCVSILDIIEDKPATWRQHAKLHKAAIISAYFSVSLPLYS